MLYKKSKILRHKNIKFTRNLIKFLEFCSKEGKIHADLLVIIFVVVNKLCVEINISGNYRYDADKFLVYYNNPKSLIYRDNK